MRRTKPATVKGGKGGAKPITEGGGRVMTLVRFKFISETLLLAEVEGELTSQRAGRRKRGREGGRDARPEEESHVGSA